MSFTPWFPEAGSYIRSFDPDSRELIYRKLTWKRDPYKYPYRFPAVAAGAKGTQVNFSDINPSDEKPHIYLAYLGLCPGFLFQFFHPYDIRQLKWDTNVIAVNQDLTANLSYDDSPYEFPTKSLVIERDRYPGVVPYNVSGASKNAEIIFIAALYRVVRQENISEDELNKLKSGTLKSYAWETGGEL